MFGIDDKTFCKIFNGELSNGVQENTYNKIKKKLFRKHFYNLA